MTDALPSAIIAYQQAMVDNDTSRFRECFRDDAVVTDDGKTYTGLDEIIGWGDELSKLELDTDITSAEAGDQEATITTLVAGDFKGSPLPFRHSIKLKDGKISRLDIAVAK